MTAMTNQTATALESLKFYVVSKSWFVRAWPILTAKPNELVDDDNNMNMIENLREHIGKIKNSDLVFVDSSTKSQTTSIDEKDEGVCVTDENENAASADNDNNSDNNHEGNSSSNSSLHDINRSKSTISEYYRRISENSETTKMKPDLLHTQDYFFLGPSAWMLVKEKFGYDGYEISRCCKKVVQQRTGGQGRIAVALLPGEENTLSTCGNSSNNESEQHNINLLSSTIVPLSGRFPYEKVLSIKNGHSACMNAISQRNEISNEVSWIYNIIHTMACQYPESACLEQTYALQASNVISYNIVLENSNRTPVRIKRMKKMNPRNPFYSSLR
jgi:hypothetical protein